MSSLAVIAAQSVAVQVELIADGALWAAGAATHLIPVGTLSRGGVLGGAGTERAAAVETGTSCRSRHGGWRQARPLRPPGLTIRLETFCLSAIISSA